MQNELACMNCQKPVSGEQAKLFAQVYVCEVCHEQATHFYDKLQQELRHLLTIAQEAIRTSLVEGRFHFQSTTSETTPSKREVLEAILALDERRCQDLTTPIQLSTGNTLPSALTQDAVVSASSSKVCRRD